MIHELIHEFGHEFVDEFVDEFRGGGQIFDRIFDRIIALLSVLSIMALAKKNFLSQKLSMRTFLRSLGYNTN
jgi:hypothetical protein